MKSPKACMLVLAVLISLVLSPVASPLRAFGQTKQIYKVGDAVQVDPQLTQQWSEGTITSVTELGGKVYGYVVRVNSGPAGAGKSLRLSVAHFRPSAQNSAATAPVAPGQFKVGDRVLTSINSSIGDYQPCTIMGPLSQNVYPVRCDPYKGRPFTDWGAFPQFIKAWPGATPAPVVQACSFSVPGGTVTRNSPPTAQTFQRVIYNMYAVSKDGQWGMTFTRFDIGAPFKNNVISNGTGGVELAHPKAPQGATVYPITSEYVRCVNVDASYDERTIVDVNWACMKNNDGDWDCPTYSTAEVIKRERVPKAP